MACTARPRGARTRTEVGTGPWPGPGACAEGKADAGSGAVLILALLLVAAAGLLAVAWLAGALHAAAGLRAAADLTALAAAQRLHLLGAPVGPCPEQVGEQARVVAQANRANLQECRVDGAGAVVVRVGPTGPRVRGAPTAVLARAGLCQEWPPGRLDPDSGESVPADLGSAGQGSFERRSTGVSERSAAGCGSTSDP